MLFLLLYFTFINFLCCILLGFWIGRFGAFITSFICFSISFLIFLIKYLELLETGSVCYLNFGIWLFSGSLISFWGFFFDALALTMVGVVLIVSFTVHIYSVGYMFYDPHVNRFLAYLSLFTFFMLTLISADNLLVFFTGWEGVGVCSYLLISFWYTRVQAVKSALKALILNRVGDFFLICGLLLIYSLFGTFDFLILFNLVPFYANLKIFGFGYCLQLNSVIAFFLLIGVVGKSAQLGLHLWLPDAMEGPTPVSALIHAATMVTAGVFLLIRGSFFFETSIEIMVFLVVLGLLTSLFSALTGLVQNDIKKIIAYSTCSQLGYMVFTCGLAQPVLSFFHLANHAFFKALLFLGAGSLIHCMGGEQDIRKMGFLFKKLPFSYSVFFIGSMSLSGIPFLSGFYSKDLLIENCYSHWELFSLTAFWFSTLVALLTAVYSFRVFYFIFWEKSFFFLTSFHRIKEVSLFTGLSLIFLCFLSITSGYLLKDLFFGFGTSFFQFSVTTTIATQFDQAIIGEFLPFRIKIIPVISSFFGIFSLLGFYLVFKKNFLYFKLVVFLNFYFFLVNKWYFDRFYNQISLYLLRRISYFVIYVLIEKGLLLVFGPLTILLLTGQFGRFLNRYCTGYVYNYACAFVMNLFYLIFILEVCFF